MNRNVESHFAELPSVEIQRSMFDRSSSHKTSFNVGELIPFYVDEVLPGDTFNVSTSCVVRLQTLLTPVMDNVYMDIYYFFVPSRICWNHWKEFMGENTDSPWIPTTNYQVPVVSYPEDGFLVGTIADYMGVPTNVYLTNDADKPIALPFRAYAQICNQWFLDQNVSDPLNIPLGDSDQTGSNGSDYVDDVANGGKPFKVAKYHDMFTSCLPSPQKGPAINIFGNEITGLYSGFNQDQSVPVISADASHGVGYYPLKLAYDTAPHGEVVFNVQRNPSGQRTVTANGLTPSGYEDLSPINLWADVGNMNLSINQLRLSFQIQKYYEKLARGGSRYREILLEMFGVHSPDARMMIPEYLGGHRFPLAIHQVTNQSQGESEFLGDLGAMSNTADVNDDFIKSFTEHGYVIGVCCVRYDHSYPQGLERMWSRRNKLDYYWPVFASIGEQPRYKREIMLSDDGNNGNVFGYNEAWAEYRFKPNRVSGEMRPGIENSLASWHLADYYETQPSLSDEWIREDKTNVDRVLAVTSEVSNQVFADFYIKNTCTRPMPMYSIPGLIDHH